MGLCTTPTQTMILIPYGEDPNMGTTLVDGRVVPIWHHWMVGGSKLALGCIYGHGFCRLEDSPYMLSGELMGLSVL